MIVSIIISLVYCIIPENFIINIFQKNKNKVFDDYFNSPEFEYERKASYFFEDYDRVNPVTSAEGWNWFFNLQLQQLKDQNPGLDLKQINQTQLQSLLNYSFNKESIKKKFGRMSGQPMPNLKNFLVKNKFMKNIKLQVDFGKRQMSNLQQLDEIIKKNSKISEQEILSSTSKQDNKVAKEQLLKLQNASVYDQILNKQSAISKINKGHFFNLPTQMNLGNYLQSQIQKNQDINQIMNHFIEVPQEQKTQVQKVDSFYQAYNPISVFSSKQHLDKQQKIQSHTKLVSVSKESYQKDEVESLHSVQDRLLQKDSTSEFWQNQVKSCIDVIKSTRKVPNPQVKMESTKSQQEKDSIKLNKGNQSQIKQNIEIVKQMDRVHDLSSLERVLYQDNGQTSDNEYQLSDIYIDKN